MTTQTNPAKPSEGPTHVTLRLPYMQHPRGDRADIVLEDVSVEALRENGFVPASQLAEVKAEVQRWFEHLEHCSLDHQAFTKCERNTFGMVLARFKTLWELRTGQPTPAPPESAHRGEGTYMVDQDSYNYAHPVVSHRLVN